MKKLFFAITPLFAAVACSRVEPVVSEVPKTAVETWLLPSAAPISSYAELPVSDRIAVHMARGEAEHIQLVVKTPVRGALEIVRRSPTEGVSMEVREVRRFNNADDALVPVSGGVVTKTKAAKLWLSFETSHDTPAGTFDEKIAIEGSALGGAPAEVVIQINVYDAAIPETPSVTALFGIDPDYIADAAGEALTAKRREFSDELLRRRITPYFWLPNDSGVMDCLSSPYAAGDTRTLEYLNDPRMTDVVLPCQSISTEQLSALVGSVKDKGRIYYVLDEPTTVAQYDKINAAAEALHRVDAGGRVITPFYRGPDDDASDFGDMLSVWDYLNETSIFCTSTWALQCNENRAAQSLAKCEPGEEWWIYVCMDERPGLAYNSTNVENRAVMWRTYKERAQGFLFWSVNTFASFFPLRPVSIFPPGDGVLIYPGDSFGSEKPVVSMRLERWRDGAEDYELMKYIEERLSRDDVLSLLGGVYPGSANSITSDHQAVEMFHRELLNRAQASY